jgi:hypothetical protein
MREGVITMNTNTKSSLDSLVSQIYHDFQNDFNAENFPSVFDWMAMVNSAGNFGKGGHPLALSAAPIFQTPVRLQPKLMLVGNNNSWFDSNDSKAAQKNLAQLVGAAPAVSSYMVHDTTFGRSLRKVFGRDKGPFSGLNKLGVLQECVGINRLWIQIGPDDKPKGAPRGMKSVAADRSPILDESFRNYCESRTRHLIEAIAPEVLVLIGSEAQTLYQHAPKPVGIKVVDARHPARGGEQKMADSIRPYL